MSRDDNKTRESPVRDMVCWKEINAINFQKNVQTRTTRHKREKAWFDMFPAIGRANWLPCLEKKPTSEGTVDEIRRLSGEAQHSKF